MRGMRTRFPLFVFLAAVVLFPMFAWASVSELPSRPRGHVSDYANTLSGSDALERELSAFRTEHGTEVDVVLLASLPDKMSMEEAAHTLYAQWPAGSSSRDDGVLLLVVLDQKQARIEAGYGLHGVLSEDVSRDLLQASLAPAFARGQYDDGIRAAVHAILDRLVHGDDPSSIKSVRTSSGVVGVAAIAFPGILVVVALLFFRMRLRRSVRSVRRAGSPAARARDRIVKDL